MIAESFERIHRSNLVGMGVLPLQFRAGESRESLGLDGTESYAIEIDDTLRPRQEVTVTASAAAAAATGDGDGGGGGGAGDGGGAGESKAFAVVCRLDTPIEVEYYRNGGILHTVLRKLAAGVES